VSSLKDNAWSSFPPVGIDSDGIICECTLNDRRCNSNGELVVQGVLYVCGDEMNADVDKNDLFCDTLGKMKDGGCLSL